jgi:hypothetical protein
MLTHIPLQSETRTRTAVWIVLSSWFVLALAGSILGAFQSGNRPPLPLGLMAIVPVAAFLAGYSWSESFRLVVLRADPRWLTAAQSWRVMGVVFLILYQRGLLPGSFALPAGWGDISIGITAPLIALAMSSHDPRLRKVFIAWNMFGILDLVTAVTLGVLNSASPAGILASGGITTRLIDSFPLSLVPTFLVPLFLIFHLLTLSHLRADRKR